MGGSVIYRTFLLFALVAALLFSGCISIKDRHAQLANGNATITQVLDMSSLMSLAGSYGSSYSDDELKATMGLLCVNVTAEHPEVKCKSGSNAGSLELERTYGPSDSFYTFEIKDDIIFTRYRLTVDRLPEMYDTSSLGDTSSYSYLSTYTKPDSNRITAPSSKASASMLKTMGVTYEYEVAMPGSITAAEGAKSMNSSAAVFDVLERMESAKPIVVESQEFNWLVIALLAIGGLVVLAGAVFVILTVVRK